MSKVIEVNSANFESEVVKHQGLVLADFAAEWCGPCKRLAPTVAEISEELAGKVKVVHIDVDACGDIAGKYGILSVPTVIIFKNGERVDESIGLVAKDRLVEKIEEYL